MAALARADDLAGLPVGIPARQARGISAARPPGRMRRHHVLHAYRLHKQSGKATGAVIG